MVAKVLFITSSWRKKSNSTCLAAHAAEGAKQSGHDVTTVDIARLRIGPCRGCMACQKTRDGRCVQQDDMHQLYPMVEEADVLVFATPVYWFNLCGQIKQFIDRCFPLAGKATPDGAMALGNKRILLILAYGGEDAFDSGGINALRSIQDICAYTGAIFAGALHGAASDENEMANDPTLLVNARAFGAAL